MVLGAGMVGICTAIHLLRRGFDVALVDRRGAGQETSYGNAGLIQREATRPYAFPTDLQDLRDVALARNNDVHYALGALPGLSGRLARYAVNSTPWRYRRVFPRWRTLIETCQAEHKPLLDESESWDLVTRGGWRLGFRTDGRDFDAARRDAETRIAEDGLAIEIEDSQTLAAREPALRRPMAGAVWWKDAWAVNDPGGLAGRYFEIFLSLGGQFVRGDATNLAQTAGGWRVRTPDGVIEAAQCVVALGPWSDVIARPLGYRFPLFVKRGYHAHHASAAMPSVPMLDSDYGVMIAPMRQGLRLTTGAEFLPRDAAPTPVQLAVAQSRVGDLFDLGEMLDPAPWLGCRPMLPDMLPNIGPAPRHSGLWFNFGHGHQGFTLGPSSGRLLADLIAGETPMVNPQPYRPDRWF